MFRASVNRIAKSIIFFLIMRFVWLDLISQTLASCFHCRCRYSPREVLFQNKKRAERVAMFDEGPSNTKLWMFQGTEWDVLCFVLCSTPIDLCTPKRKRKKKVTLTRHCIWLSTLAFSAVDRAIQMLHSKSISAGWYLMIASCSEFANDPRIISIQFSLRSGMANPSHRH